MTLWNDDNYKFNDDYDDNDGDDIDDDNDGDVDDDNQDCKDWGKFCGHHAIAGRSLSIFR